MVMYRRPLQSLVVHLPVAGPNFPFYLVVPCRRSSAPITLFAFIFGQKIVAQIDALQKVSWSILLFIASHISVMIDLQS
jgi:hypothetical protein